MGNHLFDLIKARMPAPTAPFAFLDDGRTYSYADMVAVSARFANALAGLGVKPGDRVAVQVEKSIEALMLYLGTVRAGAIFLPLNTAYTPAEIEYFLGDAEPTVFVCDPAKAEALKPFAEKAGAKLETLGVWRSPEISAGTLSDRALAASTEFPDVARFTKSDVLLHALPIFHTHGLFVATNVILFAGATMILLPKFDPEQVFKYLPRATSMMGVPTFYVRLLQDKRLTREAVKHMRLFVSGSAPLLAETHREWRERTGHAILERYGMTETNMNTSNPYDGDRVAGTVGFPLPGVSARVTDPETGKELARDEIGMIEVKGPNVFKGYWRNPEKTKAEFRPDGFFITGDLGKIDPAGYVHIVGRGKDLIITGGYNVYPKEVEAEIDDMPGVIESAVIGCPHPDFGEGVTAVVVARPGADVSAAGIARALEQRLAKFKLPKQVFIVPELPRNTMGKVQKNLLREQYKDIYARQLKAGE
jgi:malonyl-CoA/methylmalonyl-CoA synthetase